MAKEPKSFPIAKEAKITISGIVKIAETPQTLKEKLLPMLQYAVEDVLEKTMAITEIDINTKE